MAETSNEDLSFERAEVAGGAAPEGVEAIACSSCGQPVRGAYYHLNGAVLCISCRRKKVEEQGSPLGRFARAALLGGLAAALGTAIWYAIGKLTGYEFGLIAILIGLLVGGAVRFGSRRRGGWLYQGLAMFLTYSSIVATYIPDIVEAAMNADGRAAVEDGADREDDEALSEREASEQAADSAPVAAAEEEADVVATAAETEEFQPGPLEVVLGLGALFALAFAAPFFGGFENFMGWIILAIGLYEAWKLNRREDLVFEGPFRIAGAPRTAAPELPPPPIQP